MVFFKIFNSKSPPNFSLGNYFWQPPTLPLTLCSLRLSVTGQENVHQLLTSLQQQTKLVNIHLQLQCFEEDAVKINIILIGMLRIERRQVSSFWKS